MACGVGEDDFFKFLDLDTDFQFADLNNGQSGLDTPMGRLGFGLTQQPVTLHNLGYNNDHGLNMYMSAVEQAGFQSHVPNTQHFEHYTPYSQIPLGHGYNIPPTPISSEMHGGKYGQRWDNAGNLIFDGRQVSLSSKFSNKTLTILGPIYSSSISCSDSDARRLQHTRIQ